MMSLLCCVLSLLRQGGVLHWVELRVRGLELTEKVCLMSVREEHLHASHAACCIVCVYKSPTSSDSGFSILLRDGIDSVHTAVAGGVACECTDNG